MPHIAVSMYPGRDRDTKEALAKKLEELVSQELNVDKKYVSVSIEDVAKDHWKERMSQIPEDLMFVHPDY